MIPSVANSSVSDTRPCWCLKHQNIEALLVISLSQVPLCLANMYGAACVTKPCGSVEGWIAKAGTWYVFRLTGGFFKWSCASSGLWFDLVFRDICDCTTKSPAVFVTAAKPAKPAAAATPAGFWLPVEGVIGGPTVVFPQWLVLHLLSGYTEGSTHNLTSNIFGFLRRHSQGARWCWRTTNTFCHLLCPVYFILGQYLGTAGSQTCHGHKQKNNDTRTD